MRLLFVCTGNLCRSPLAERLMRAWTSRELPSAADRVRIESAGTAAAQGPMDDRSATALRELGGDPTGFSARSLALVVTTDVDLVLTMTREQRRAVLQQDPRALRRTFTLTEAAALLSLVDRSGLHLLSSEERVRELAIRLDATRARRSGGPEDDIVDPIGQSLAVHRAVATMITKALRPLADVLLAPMSGPPLRSRPTAVDH